MTPPDAVYPPCSAELATPARAIWSGRHAIIAAGACLLGLAIMYRVQIASGGTVFASDALDGRIAVALGEHWFNVFRGLEAWNEPGYFAPASNVLGYNDGYLIYGVVFSILRWAGLDGILSGELTGAVFRVAGFVGMVRFAAGPCRFGVRWAVLAALLAMVGNAGYIQAAHVQLTTVGLAPWLGWLLWRAGGRLQTDGRGAIAWSCATAVLVAAWLMTAFYTIWFTALFAGLMGVAALAARPAACLAAIRQCRLTRLLPAALLLVAGCLPFLRVYLPKAHETGMHPYADALFFAPTLPDLVHVGPGNLLFGWFDTAITQLVRPGFAAFDHLVGFAPVLFCLAVAGAVWAIVQPLGGAWRRPLAVAFVLSLLLCLRIGDHSAWWLVFATVPGAPAIRVVARFYLLLGLVAPLLAVDALRRLPARWAWLVPVLATVLVAEEVNAGGLFALRRDDESPFLAAMPPPPPRCRAFIALQPRPVIRGGEHEWGTESVLMNVDAMVLAARFHIPTLNGHATFLPPGFGFGYRDPAQYAAAARATIIGLGMAGGTCGVRLSPPAWSTNPLGLAPLTWNHAVRFGAGGEADAYTLRHWYSPEPAGRWTDGLSADLAMVLPASGAVRVELRAAPFAAPGWPASPVRLYANGTKVAEWRLEAGDQTISATIPADVVGPLGNLGLRLVIDDPMSPKQLGLGGDDRRLGLFVEGLKLIPVPP